ncbi:hypothetical protein [Tychonema sp. BBK16]|nr:hypothetical protein [Tychonema sp. BBK16]MCF6375461.1 hypothetical protein [Tychonema sp. BBK16]
MNCFYVFLYYLTIHEYITEELLRINFAIALHGLYQFRLRRNDIEETAVP